MVETFKRSSRYGRMPAQIQFNSQASLSLSFCASPVSRPFDFRRTKPRRLPQLRRKEPECLTTVCTSYAHYRWLVHPDVKRFFHMPRDLPYRRPCACSARTATHLQSGSPERQESMLDSFDTSWSTSRAFKPAARAPLKSAIASSPTCNIAVTPTLNRRAAT